MHGRESYHSADPRHGPPALSSCWTATRRCQTVPTCTTLPPLPSLIRSPAGQTNAPISVNAWGAMAVSSGAAGDGGAGPWQALRWSCTLSPQHHHMTRSYWSARVSWAIDGSRRRSPVVAERESAVPRRRRTRRLHVPRSRFEA